MSDVFILDAGREPWLVPGGAWTRAERRRLEDRRPNSRAVDGMFAARERDRPIYGSTLAGALAFRVFHFLVPFTLVSVSIVGFAVSTNPGAEDRLSERFGLGGALAGSIVAAADQSHPSRRPALSIGLVGRLWAALGAVRALRLSHSLAWGPTPRRLRRPHYGVALCIAEWMAASTALPRKPARWTSLVHGALVVTAGAQALHLTTVFELTQSQRD